MVDILRAAPMATLVDGQITKELLVAIGDEPVSVEGTLKDDHWQLAMVEELDSIRENKTWTLVDL
jgi:hypothetical protein